MSLDCVMGIDPGPEQSGFAILYGSEIIDRGVMPNPDMRDIVRSQSRNGRDIAIEMIASYGMPVGAEVFETCIWIGRFIEASLEHPFLLPRKEVVQHICGNAKGKDANVRQALIDMFPRTGGGKCPQIGTKKKPGPLFGFNSHMWPALGVAITARDTK